MGVVRGRRRARARARAERTELPRRAGARGCDHGVCHGIRGRGRGDRLVERPAAEVLWLGVVWTGVICIVDRLIYKSFGTSRTANLPLAVPRAALSVMLALVFGLPMVQFIFQPSISKQLTQTSAVEREERAPGGDRLLRAQDQAGKRGHCGDAECRDYAQNRVAEVRAPLRVREQRAVVLTHTPLRLRALVSLLRCAGERRRAEAPRERMPDRRKIAVLNARIADWRPSEAAETSGASVRSARTRTCSPARRR